MVGRRHPPRGGAARVDGQPLESEEDLNKALDRAREAGQRGVLLEGVQANGQQFYAGVPLP